MQGTEYKTGCWLCTGSKQNDTCSLPIFGKLQEIVFISSDESCKKLLLIVQKSVTLGFFRRVYGYVVRRMIQKDMIAFPLAV